MDYLTRRDIAIAYGTVGWTSGSSRFPRIAAAGPRVICDANRHVVPRRELEQALVDLQLVECVGALPEGELLDAASIEEQLAHANLDPTALKKMAAAHLNFLARPARERRIREAAKDLLANDDDITQWLNTPSRALGGRSPMDLIDTDAGTADVEGFIRGLAYGNFQ